MTLDACAKPELLPLEDALAQMLRQIAPLTASQSLALSECLDRVLAEALVSPIAVPPQDNSAMDGYALCGDCATGERLPLIGQALAGHPFAVELTPGQALRITTGAPIPPGADRVIMQEQVEVFGDAIQLKRSPGEGDNIRRAGEDILQGSQVLAKGQRISALDIGLAASLGVSHLQVIKRPRVALISTGDELIAPGMPLAPGQIYDSNRYALKALLQRLDVETIDLGQVGDAPDALQAVFERAAHSADAIVCSGGVSVGDADFTRSLLSDMGRLDVWQLAIKPGKPFAFGQLPSPSGAPVWFFGLPGNPVSALVTYHQLVIPALKQLAGETASQSPNTYLTAKALVPLKKQPGRMDFQRGILQLQADGSYGVSSTGTQGSGQLSSLAKANAYIVLERERGSVAAGEEVQVLPFDRYIR